MNDTTGAGDPVTILSMLQLADTFFPSGLYTLSHGLESLVQTGQVSSAAELELIIEDYIAAVNGPADSVGAAAAAGAARAIDIAAIVAIDQCLLSLKLPHEAALASVRAGKRLLSLARDLHAGMALGEYAARVAAGEAPGNYAIGLGVLSAGWGMSPQQAALVELYSFVTGLLGAALRIMRLDHAQSQAILSRIKPLIARTAAEAASTPYQDMHSFAPAIEIAQMQHERADVRLFAS